MTTLEAQRQRYAIRASVERGGFDLPDDYDPLALSPREREVLGLFADGLTRPEVARRLWIFTGDGGVPREERAGEARGEDSGAGGLGRLSGGSAAEGGCVSASRTRTAVPAPGTPYTYGRRAARRYRHARANGHRPWCSVAYVLFGHRTWGRG